MKAPTGGKTLISACDLRWSAHCGPAFRTIASADRYMCKYVVAEVSTDSREIAWRVHEQAEESVR